MFSTTRQSNESKKRSLGCYRKSSRRKRCEIICKCLLLGLGGEFDWGGGDCPRQLEQVVQKVHNSSQQQVFALLSLHSGMFQRTRNVPARALFFYALHPKLWIIFAVFANFALDGIQVQVKQILIVLGSFPPRNLRFSSCHTVSNLT